MKEGLKTEEKREGMISEANLLKIESKWKGLYEVAGETASFLM